MVKDQFFESDQKVAKFDKIVGVLNKKTSVINYGLAKGVSVLVLVILVIVMGWKSFGGFKHQCQNSRWGWQYLPVGATSSTPLHKQCQETILVNNEGNLWNVSLRFSESGGKYYITRGWKKFCLDNRCEIGDLFVFNVVGDGKTTPLMCVCPERKDCSEILSKYLSRKSGESSLGGDS
ncbi:hypothetical protein Bca4012_073578 [Brassica carinata]